MTRLSVLAAIALVSTAAAEPQVHGHWSLYDDVSLGSACFFMKQVTVHLPHHLLNPFSQSGDDCLDVPGLQGVSSYCVWSDRVRNDSDAYGISLADYKQESGLGVGDNLEGFVGNLLSLRNDMQSCNNGGTRLLLHLDLEAVSEWEGVNELGNRLHERFTREGTRKLDFAGFDLGISSGFEKGPFLKQLASSLRDSDRGLTLAATSECPRPSHNLHSNAPRRLFDSIARPNVGAAVCQDQQRRSMSFRGWLKDGSRGSVLSIPTADDARIPPKSLQDDMPCTLSEGLGGLMLSNINNTMTAGNFYIQYVLQAVGFPCTRAESEEDEDEDDED